MKTGEVTDDQICEYRAHALASGELEEAAICDFAIGRRDRIESDMFETIYSLVSTPAAARIVCASLISEMGARP
jgi:hypothetical protein